MASRLDKIGYCVVFGKRFEKDVEELQVVIVGQRGQHSLLVEAEVTITPSLRARNRDSSRGKCCSTIERQHIRVPDENEDEGKRRTAYAEVGGFQAVFGGWSAGPKSLAC